MADTEDMLKLRIAADDLVRSGDPKYERTRQEIDLLLDAVRPSYGAISLNDISDAAKKLNLDRAFTAANNRAKVRAKQAGEAYPDPAPILAQLDKLLAVDQGRLSEEEITLHQERISIRQKQLTRILRQ
jgi:hypothetical protein